MKDCIQKITRELRQMNSPDFQRTLLQAALLLEKHYVPKSKWRGIEPDVDDAEVSDASTQELRDALMAFAKTHREHVDVGTALWALGKYRGSSLREFFINEMKAHLAAKRFFLSPRPKAHFSILVEGLVTVSLWAKRVTKNTTRPVGNFWMSKPNVRLRHSSHIFPLNTTFSIPFK